MRDRGGRARRAAAAPSLGTNGSHWETSARSAHAIVDLPDSRAAAAVAAVLTHTGAFKNVEVHEVLTQDDFNAVLELADSVSEVYTPPGSALLQDDASRSRFQR